MTAQLLAASHVQSGTTSVIFWVLAIVSVAAALGMVMARRAVHCAVLLAVVMLCLAVLYATAGAPFLAFVQIIVYTGAVLMLFLFVLMIVGVTAADSTRETIPGQRLAAGLAGIALLVLAHRERTSPKPTQRDLARQRAAGPHLAPLPGPGTYARHNAVDFPALLPDGSPSELSVSAALLRRGGGQPVPGGSQAGLLPAAEQAENGAEGDSHEHG